jgi:glycerol-3-phosphate cytidylyltransferase
MKRNGFVAGSFDLLHCGHILMLKEAKEQCQILTVGLHVDPSKERKGKNKPIQSVFERMMQLNACQYVNEVIVYETEKELEILLWSLLPDIRFLDEEYKNKPEMITAPDVCPIYYNTRKHNYSSSELRDRIKNG